MLLLHLLFDTLVRTNLKKNVCPPTSLIHSQNSFSQPNCKHDFYLAYGDVNNAPLKIKQVTPDASTGPFKETTGTAPIPPPPKQILSAGILFSGGMPMTL